MKSIPILMTCPNEHCSTCNDCIRFDYYMNILDYGILPLHKGSVIPVCCLCYEFIEEDFLEEQNVIHRQYRICDYCKLSQSYDEFYAFKSNLAKDLTQEDLTIPKYDFISNIITGYMQL